MKKITVTLAFAMGITVFSALGVTKPAQTGCIHFSGKNYEPCLKKTIENLHLTYEHTLSCAIFHTDNELPCLDMASLLTPQQIEACSKFSKKNQQMPCLKITSALDLSPENITACSKFAAQHQLTCLDMAFRLTSEQITACSKLSEKNQTPCLRVTTTLNLTPEHITACSKLSEDNQLSCLNQENITPEQITACAGFLEENQSSCLDVTRELNLTPQ